jgi:uncharacterized membrane protein YgcG
METLSAPAVILGHISATITDLAQRGFLRIEEVPGSDGAEWLLTDLRGQPGSGATLPFEAILLDGLFARQSEIRLTGISQELIPVLSQVRRHLRRDAVRNGRLRRFPRGRRPPYGEQLLSDIHEFRRELRRAVTASPGLSEALAPYAMIFGLPMPSDARVATYGAATAQPRETEVPRSRFRSFGYFWIRSCEKLISEHRQGQAEPHGTRSHDFVRQWSPPRGHDHASPGHGGHGGGFDGGGHGGGFDGGGHGGGFGGGGHGG